MKRHVTQKVTEFRGSSLSEKALYDNRMLGGNSYLTSQRSMLYVDVRVWRAKEKYYVVRMTPLKNCYCVAYIAVVSYLFHL